jgi:DNA modification methylase
MIINGNNIEELKKFDDNYFDSIVTDPPYEIGFMGKSWDASGIANNPEMWSECLRVLKPGGYLLSFSATRTYHRMAVAIEDSGFEIRDMIEWVYGTGFPKSLNIGKAVDKIAPRLGQFDKFAEHFSEQIKVKGISQKEISKLFPSKTGGLTGCVWNWANGANVPTLEQYKTLKPLLDLSGEFTPLIERIEREREIVGRGKAGLTSGTIANFAGEKEFDLTKGTSEWEGKGTALKPAHEPICMARKPLAEKTVAENVLKWGTGGINIDESRVGTDLDLKNDINNRPNRLKGIGITEKSGVWKGIASKTLSNVQDLGSLNSMGRFPANLIHDNSEEVRECFPNESERFFKSIIYQAKASKSERNKGCEGLKKANAGSYEFRTDGSLDKPTQPKSNHHPTVKPVALMEYLIKMVTPTNGIVLDPFMGSGTTGVACVLNDFEFVGIDLDKDYCEIARARIEGVKETQTKMF